MLLVLQYRKGLAGAHEVFVISRKLVKWGGKYSDMVIVNVANQAYSFDIANKYIKQASAIIIGGSGEYGFYDLKGSDVKSREFKKLLVYTRDILKTIFINNVPTLGICFGHQLLGWFLGANIITQGDKYKETGVQQVKLTKNGKQDLLFKDIPHSFYASFGHKSSVINMPSKTRYGNIIHLAYNNKIKWQAFKINDQYGVQFHPELDYEENIERDNLYQDAKYTPEYLPPIDQVQPYISEQLMFNFFDMFLK